MSSGFYCTQCIVCGREDKYRRKLRFFRFPKETERCRSWLRVIGIKDLVYMSLSELFEQIVCEIHFHQQSFSGKGKRLLKIALPTMFTSHPPLSAKIMAEWPPKYGQGPQMQQCDDTMALVNKGGNRNPTLRGTEPVINYERPLMTCMETLINNKQDYDKKPTGLPNTISVPLMTYCNSLEKGTVFAPEEPVNLSDLPVVIIENIDLNLPATKNSMEMNTNTTVTTLTKKSHVTRLPDSIDPSQHDGTVIKHIKHKARTPINTMMHQYNTGTLHQYKTPYAKPRMNTPDISLCPFTGSMNQECEATTDKKPYVVSLGLNTIIRSRKNRAELSSQTVPTRNDSNRVLGLNSVQATTDSNTNFRGIPGPNTVYMEHGQTNSDSVTINTEHLARPNILKNVSPCPGYGCAKFADLNLNQFMLYSDYIPTASPECTNAHISDNIDYGMPLLNCAEIVLQGNINYNAKPEDSDNATIDAPLLSCMKIIKSIE